MKRTKEDEKIMRQPMFPRLHVNDTERGGPRAPPRNKMALYEQLTISSQRYNSCVAPPKQNYDNKSASSTSTLQVGVLLYSSHCVCVIEWYAQVSASHEQNTHFPLYRPSPAPSDNAVQVRNGEASNSNNPPVRVDNKKKPVEKDYFMVPIFSAVGTEMHIDKTPNKRDREGHLHLSSNHHATNAGEETNRINSGHLVSKQKITVDDGRTLRLSTSTRHSLDMSLSGRDDIPWENGPSSLREHQNKHKLGILVNTSDCLVEDQGNNMPDVDVASDEDVPDLQRDTSLSLRLKPPRVSGSNCDNESNQIIHRIDDDQYIEKESIDQGNDASETSMVDSASELDITPGDVVGVIGRKQFCKARTAIVNQQRVFAVQVFELHRLLKVQKLIAGSPNLLLGAAAFVGNSSEFVVKTLPHKSIQKEVITHRSIDKVEGTAENVGPKTPTPALISAPDPSQQYPVQPPAHPSFSGGVDSKMNPWGFHQPSAHQWLMTPTECLVYKPYPAPGFMGPTPMTSNPSFGAPIPQYHQGLGMPPGIHFGGHGYFPPYGMQMMSSAVSSSTVDHPNTFSGSNPYIQPGQQGSSQNADGQENVISLSATRPRARKQSEQNRELNPNPHSEFSEDTPPKEKQARVIRAVPHRSTSDFAARIFESIQQERQLYESS